MSPIVSPDVSEENIQLDLDRPHMEIMDTREVKVWQAMSAVTREEYQALAIEPPYLKLGVGLAAMDSAYFRRSPGAAADGPMEARELFGYSWRYCARPQGAPELVAGPEGPRKLRVDKHHVLLYRAGRELSYLVLPDGTEHVHVISGEAPLVLPEGWELRSEHLDHELKIELPAPATVFFFPNGDSYQGPVGQP